MHLLIVEDNLNARAALAVLLQRAGHTCDQVETVEGAELRLTDQHYDAAIVDHYLPDLTGMDLIYDLRQKLGITHLPVVVTTAAAEAQELAEELVHLQPAVLLRKPFDPDVLLVALESLAGHRP